MVAQHASPTSPLSLWKPKKEDKSEAKKPSDITVPVTTCQDRESGGLEDAHKRGRAAMGGADQLGMGSSKIYE